MQRGERFFRSVWRQRTHTLYETLEHNAIVIDEHARDPVSWKLDRCSLPYDEDGGCIMLDSDQGFSQSDVRRVLVVDDHPDTTEILSMIFQRLGHETRSSQRGRDALRMAREFDPDLILLDIWLPDITGYEVVNALRAQARAGRPHIVAITGWGHAQDSARSLEAGFDDHVVKPIDLAAIRKILRTVGTHAREPVAESPRVRTDHASATTPSCVTSS